MLVAIHLLSPPFSQIYRSDNYFDSGGGPGWPSPAAATAPGGILGRIRTDTNGIRSVTDEIRQDTNHSGTMQRPDRLSAATAEPVSTCRN